MNNCPHNVELKFSVPSPTIFLCNLHRTIKIRTYVTYFYQQKLCHGKIVSTHHNRDHKNSVSVRINKYLTHVELEEQLGAPELLPTYFKNRLIAVKELYQSALFCDVQINDIHGIMFVFKADVILKDPYEGSHYVFCIWYKVDEMNIGSHNAELFKAIFEHNLTRVVCII